MNEYNIIADGFSQINILKHYQEIPKVSEEEKRYLEDFVREQTRKSEERKGLFFDGDMIGVKINSIKSEGTKLELETQSMKYSQHAGLFRLNPNVPLQALYVNSILITKDDKIVFGTTQATEAQWMGKLNLPAGGLTLSPDKYPSPGEQIEREIAQEIGLISGVHYDEQGIIPGWMNGMSSREGNYHYTISFVTPLNLDEKQLIEWFEGIRDLVSRLGIKTEFKKLSFFPNDPEYIKRFIEKQDEKGKDANLLGRSCDVIEEWSRTYECDPEKLKQSKLKGSKVYLSQPEIF